MIILSKMLRSLAEMIDEAPPQKEIIPKSGEVMDIQNETQTAVETAIETETENPISELPFEHGIRYTQVVEITPEQIQQLLSKNPSFAQRIKNRFMTKKQWIEAHGSGTLRKNGKNGMGDQNQYLHERIAYEFGWTFELIPQTRICWGVGFTEGDCHEVTEYGWHTERYNEHLFPGDIAKACYLIVDPPGEKRKEGLGILIRRTTASFVPKGHIVYAIIAPVKKGKFTGKVKNPF